MTSADATIILELLLSADLAEEHRRLRRAHELACSVMRRAPTPELRTAARLHVLALEQGMVRP